LQATDIDQVTVGQATTLKFAAFNQRTTPEIAGFVSDVTPDVIRNAQTGETWYVARIGINSDEIKHLGGLTIVAGMPVEAYIQTGSRTALSYLMKPLADHISRALREE
jgi:HlyD family secretion protein